MTYCQSAILEIIYIYCSGFTFHVKFTLMSTPKNVDNIRFGSDTIDLLCVVIQVKSGTRYSTEYNRIIFIGTPSYTEGVRHSRALFRHTAFM